MIFFWLCFCCCFFCWMNLLGLFVWLVLLLQFLEPWNSWRLRFGGKAKVLACSSSSKRYVLSGCLRKEQQLGWIFDLLGGGFKCFFIFTPTWGNHPIWLIFFQMGWNHQAVLICIRVHAFCSTLIEYLFSDFLKIFLLRLETLIETFETCTSSLLNHEIYSFWLLL